MSDIVERLRATKLDKDNFPRMDSEAWLPVGLAQEAADEIERLREHNRIIMGRDPEEILDSYKWMKDEIGRLSAERDSARISNSIETEQHLGFVELCDQLRERMAEAAAFLDGLADMIDMYNVERFTGPLAKELAVAAADCRAMARKLST